MAEQKPDAFFDIPDESEKSRRIPDGDAIDFDFTPAPQDRLDVVAPIEEAKLAPNTEEPPPGVTPDTEHVAWRSDQVGREAGDEATDTTADTIGDGNLRSFAREPSAERADTPAARDQVVEPADGQSGPINEPAPAQLGQSSGEPNQQPGALRDDAVRPSVGADADSSTSSASSQTTPDGFEAGEVEAPNVAPTDIAVSGGSVDENAASGTVVATLDTVDANVADTFTYAITDDASGAFEVVGNEIRVKAGANLDYETAQSHDITVQVTDAGGLTYAETFTIAVNDVNEAPVGLTVSGGTVAENAAQGTVVAKVAGVDVDANETLTYSLVDDADGRFAIDGASGEITVADPLGLDFEAQPTHELSVRVTDAAGNSHVDTVSVSLSDVVGERVYGDGRDNVILGDLGNDYLLGGDGNDTLSGGAGTDWLYGQNGDDRISGGDGNDYLIDQSGSDHLQGGDGNDYVLDYDYYDNGRDTLEGGAGNDLLLSGGGGDVVDGGTGTDTLYYSTSREGVQITLGEAGETTTGAGGTADGDQISNVENIFASRFDDSITGNSEANTIYGYTGDDVIDGGAGNDTLYGDYGYNSAYYSGDDIITGGAGDDVIDGGAGNDTAVYTGEWADYAISRNPDGSFRIIDSENAEGSDTVRNVEQFQFSDAVLGADDLLNVAPTDIAVSGGSVDENAASGTVVATLDTVDANVADTFTYAITDDASGAFEVVGNEIRVKAGANLDYETAQSHDITVQVTDAGGLTYAETFTIAVNDVNEAPVGLTVSGGTVAENAAQGTVVAKVAGVDVDANETLTYSLVDDADGRFAIDGASGEITVADPLGLDFEAQPTHELSVRVTDAAGNSHVDTVSVSLSDVAGERVYGDGRDNVILGDLGNDYLLGGDGNDTLSGGAGTDWLYGQNGDDRISGGDGNDYLIDQSGSDHLQGGDGNDYVLDYDYYDNGRDTLEGGAGNDLLLSGGGGDVVDGGTGTDTLYYSTSREGVQITLGEAGETTTGAGGTADGDQISNVENIFASRFDDSITGNSEANTIYGYSGDDVIDGGAGNDTLYGDYGYNSAYYSGDDIITGGAGDDVIDGGAGNDLFIYTVGDGNDTIRGGAGGNWIDTIELYSGADGAALGDYGTDWSAHLTSGSIVSQDAHSISFSDDADGTISLSDGSEIDFWDVEQINF